jgi:hypothetical protein
MHTHKAVKGKSEDRGWNQRLPGESRRMERCGGGGMMRGHKAVREVRRTLQAKYIQQICRCGATRVVLAGSKRPTEKRTDGIWGDHFGGASVLGGMCPGGIKCGDRVEAGEPGTEDFDTGRVLEIEGDTADVGWDSGVRSDIAVSDLRVEAQA